MAEENGILSQVLFRVHLLPDHRVCEGNGGTEDTEMAILRCGGKWQDHVERSAK
jgi:hypothetical protein